MANVDSPSGAIVIGRMGSGEPSYRLFSVDSSNSVALFHGKSAILSTDGNVDGIEAASDDFIGIITAIYDSSGVPVKTLAASTAGSVLICDDQDAIYKIQFEGGGTAPTAAAIGDCADFIWTHSDNSDTGRAGMELSETLVGNGNSAQMRILELNKAPNNAWGHNAEVYVTPNEHAYKASHVAI